MRLYSLFHLVSGVFVGVGLTLDPTLVIAGAFLESLTVGLSFLEKKKPKLFS